MIFVDTSFWVAGRNRRDPQHAQSKALFEQVADQHLVTSNHVCGETWTFLRRRLGHSAAVGFVDSLRRSVRLEILTVSDSLESEAWRWLRLHDEREYSFVDATSFTLMRSKKIQNALAFDGDFSAAGFSELRIS